MERLSSTLSGSARHFTENTHTRIATGIDLIVSFTSISGKVEFWGQF